MKSNHLKFDFIFSVSLFLIAHNEEGIKEVKKEGFTSTTVR
jgi:hypothetical protein